MLVYILGMITSGGCWLLFFLRDEETPKTDVASWVVLIVASIFWPISVPLSYIELMTKMKVDPLQGNAKVDQFQDDTLLNSSKL